jgi:hypothetical protein
MSFVKSIALPGKDSNSPMKKLETRNENCLLENNDKHIAKNSYLELLQKNTN